SGTTNYLGYDPNSFANYDDTYPHDLNPSYPVGGGNLSVTVEGNLIGETNPAQPVVITSFFGAPSYAATELPAYWLWTESSTASPTWFVNFGTYYQPGGLNVSSLLSGVGNYGDAFPSVAAFEGIGAMGGGNVHLNVGGNMTNVDVVLP